MGLKYSINSAGRIVAERDIYSLGGFIPKGRLGGFIADETQLSQDGECWVAGGDISGRPDVRVKDNAYIGDFFAGTDPVHTDIITEFSGNTLIPGYFSVRSLVADTKNNTFIKDSFIGVSVDALCGPSTTTTAFPFEQGDFKKEAAKGTLFTSASIRLEDVSACRNTATLRLGRNTYLYIPTGYRARVFWAYYDTSNQLAYSGESTAVAAGLTKLDHSVYRLAMVAVAKADGTAMTPTDLLATGAKILGHISSSVLTDIRPESASGQYVMVNSSFIAETDNFGLITTQLRFLAGSMYDTTMYTKTDRQDYKPYGTFRNVERLEYTKYLGDSHRTAATRDTYISAYDCPLLRVDNATYNDALAAKGNLVLRRCVVPKAAFVVDKVDGNTYEDIDFSYTNEFMGTKVSNITYVCSHKQGLYTLYSGSGSLTGRASYPDNTKDAGSLIEDFDSVLLDGDIIEQGSYTASVGQLYEEGKSGSISTRIRTGKPVSTFGLVLPTMPSGYALAAAHYLDERLKFAYSVPNPSSINTDYPYVVFVITKADPSESALISEFIARNVSLTVKDYTKVPEITGSAYVGAGCIVRGDVQLHGDPYVNRVLGVNMWERGTASQSVGKSWEDSKISTTLGNRFRLMDTFPVEPGGLITCNSGYWVECGFFDSNGIFISSPGWGRTSNYVPAGTAYAGIVIKKSESASDAGGLITEGDIPLANVKYVRAFKKRRYIVNELDRTSPEDILLSVDYWEQGRAGGGQADAGKTYEELKAISGTTIRLKRPINVSPTSSISSASGFSRYIRVLDASTKFHLGESLASAKMALLAAIIQKDPSAAITPSEIANSRLVLEFVPQPRIIAPYGVSNVWIEGTKVRMYDNSVISRTITQGQEVTLKGDAVMGTVFIGDVCICSNGHDDAIIKRP